MTPASPPTTEIGRARDLIDSVRLSTSTSQHCNTQHDLPTGSTRADSTMTVPGDRSESRPVRWSLSLGDYRVSL